MDKANRLFLLSAASFLLLASMAPSAKAQYRNRNSPSPTPTPTPAARPLTPLRPGVVTTTSVANKLPGIFGQIRWKKELGLPYDGARVRPPYPVCNAFRVRVTVQEPGSPGTFGVELNVADLTVQGNPKDDSGYYVCSYAIGDQGQLQHDRAMKIWAQLDPQVLSGRESGPWTLGSEAQPPPGYQRSVTGGRGVTLADTQSRATVDFEMVYTQIPQGP